MSSLFLIQFTVSTVYTEDVKQSTMIQSQNNSFTQVYILCTQLLHLCIFILKNKILIKHFIWACNIFKRSCENKKDYIKKKGFGKQQIMLKYAKKQNISTAMLIALLHLYGYSSLQTSWETFGLFINMDSFTDNRRKETYKTYEMHLYNANSKVVFSWLLLSIDIISCPAPQN